jgi:hypothetical protein
VIDFVFLFCVWGVGVRSERLVGRDGDWWCVKIDVHMHRTTCTKAQPTHLDKDPQLPFP